MEVKQLIEKLLERELTPEDGFGEAEIETAEKRLGFRLPYALRELYLCAGKLDCFMSAFQRFLLPEELVIEDGKLIFLEENQGVCIWLAESEQDDPEALQCNEYDSMNDRYKIEESYSENTRMSEFIPILLYYQLAQGGYKHGGMISKKAITDEMLTAMVTDWDPVVRHNGLAVYWHPGCLLWYFADKGENLDRTNSGYGGVFLSARTEDRFRCAAEAYGFEEI
jgi:hypothetical protein